MRNGKKQRARRARDITGNKILQPFDVRLGAEVQTPEGSPFKDVREVSVTPKRRVLVGRDGKTIRELRGRR